MVKPARAAGVGGSQRINSACRAAADSVEIELCDDDVRLSIGMVALIVGCLKWAVVGFVVAFVLMKLYEGSHIHDDIPRPEFKVRQSRRAALVLSAFAGVLSAAVWLLVQTLD